VLHASQHAAEGKAPRERGFLLMGGDGLEPPTSWV